MKKSQLSKKNQLFKCLHNIYIFYWYHLYILYTVIYMLDVSQMLGQTVIILVVVVVIDRQGSFSTKYERRGLVHLHHSGSGNSVK